jgi:predicted ATP-grasp superfamily ATP-dependent carboligase
MFKGIVFPCSSTVTLEIVGSLNYHKNISFIGVNSHNNYEFKNLFETTFNDCPDISTNEDETINYLLNICQKYNCNFIIPTMDYSHLILSKYINKFNLVNIKIITSSYDTNLICVSKQTTYKSLNNVIPCPNIYNYNDLKEIIEPLFLKPKIGYGSRNCHIINNIDDLHKHYNDELLILEYLPGDEFTIDCFTYNKKLIYFNIRKRVLYKNGLSVITENLLNNNEIQDIAEKINNTISFVGAWFFQVKYDKNNKIKLLEISTRIAGASSINRLNGSNLTLLSLFNHFNHPIDISPNNFSFCVSKIFRNTIDFNKLDRFINVFIDFDDTIIVNNKVNENAILFLYKSLNKNKNIYLLSRHKFDIYETLIKYKIDKNIFKEIIIINDKSINKSNYVIQNSIFIDDSFKERNDVIKNINNVLTFDIDCFEFF